MAMGPVQEAEQEERRRMVGQLYICGVPKGDIAETLGCSKQTITRDVKWLIALWNKEMVKNPVAQRARTLATMQEQERIAAKRYDETGSMGWWDRWVKAVQAIAVSAVEKDGEIIRPALRREPFGHQSSPQSLTICRILAFVVGSFFRYSR